MSEPRYSIVYRQSGKRGAMQRTWPELLQHLVYLRRVCMLRHVLRVERVA